MIQTGYRLGMLVSGAGALMISARAGWFVSYAIMASLLAIGIVTFLLGPEPAGAEDTQFSPRTARPSPAGTSHPELRAVLRQWVAKAVIGPFQDFMQRPYWVAILVFVFGYKLGEAMAGVMAMPLYVALGFSLNEIAAIRTLAPFHRILCHSQIICRRRPAQINLHRTHHGGNGC